VKKNRKKILVSPLNWGLGHATRCVPIIRVLLSKGYDVVIGAEERPLAFLKIEFPELSFHELPGYSITYPEKGKMMLRMAASVPGIIHGISAEHKAVQELVRKEKIAGIISDNRFGLWHRQVPTAFMTHQVSVKAPFGESLIFRVNRHYIRKFNYCWIPDHKGEKNLSGDLSHTRQLPLTTHYVGPLSRFTKPVKKIGEGLLILLSGPEPQRTMLEKIVIGQLSQVKEKIKGKVILVRGLPGKTIKADIPSFIEAHDHLGDKELMHAISQCSLVFCRTGYTTLMDLYYLGGKAIFVPTPGQTEQEYLGKLMMEKNIGISMKQGAIDLNYALSAREKYTGFAGAHFDPKPLNTAIDEFLSLVEGKDKN